MTLKVRIGLKTALLVIAVFLLVFSTSGCNKNFDEKEKKEKQEEEQKTKVQGDSEWEKLRELDKCTPLDRSYLTSSDLAGTVIGAPVGAVPGKITAEPYQIFSVKPDITILDRMIYVVDFGGTIITGGWWESDEDIKGIITAYERFLSRFPKHKQAKSAKKRLEELQALKKMAADVFNSGKDFYLYKVEPSPIKSDLIFIEILFVRSPESTTQEGLIWMKYPEKGASYQMISNYFFLPKEARLGIILFQIEINPILQDYAGTEGVTKISMGDYEVGLEDEFSNTFEASYDFR